MNKEYPEAISHWELQQKDWQSRYRGMVKKDVNDDYVAELRKHLPFGPPSLQRIEELAGQLGIYPISLFRIWAGETFQRRAAFPEDHPMRLNINARNAADQRERYRLSKIVFLAIGVHQEWRCVYCQIELKGKGSPFVEGRKYHRDHILPLARGGETIESNIQLTCSQCNHSKNTMSDGDFRIKISRIQEALRRREKFTLLAEVLLPLVENILWADSDSASCPFCGNAAALVSSADLPRDPAVFKCSPCKKLWQCSNFMGKAEFWNELSDTIFQQWYAMYREEMQAIIDKEEEEEGPEGLRPLITEWAGHIQVLRKRNHRHKQGNSCWCEFGGNWYVPVGEPMQQEKLLPFAAGSGPINQAAEHTLK